MSIKFGQYDCSHVWLSFMVYVCVCVLCDNNLIMVLLYAELYFLSHQGSLSFQVSVRVNLKLLINHQPFYNHQL